VREHGSLLLFGGLLPVLESDSVRADGPDQEENKRNTTWTTGVSGGRRATRLHIRDGL
jgi:hypothetical protein